MVTCRRVECVFWLRYCCCHMLTQLLLILLLLTLLLSHVVKNKEESRFTLYDWAMCPLLLYQYSLHIAAIMRCNGFSDIVAIL
jgi:hypothetical protein